MNADQRRAIIEAKLRIEIAMSTLSPTFMLLETSGSPDEVLRAYSSAARALELVADMVAKQMRKP